MDCKKYGERLISVVEKIFPPPKKEEKKEELPNEKSSPKAEASQAIHFKLFFAYSKDFRRKKPIKMARKI